MILLLSGEGKTDMGRVNGGVFEPGPMAVLTDLLIQDYQGYDLPYIHNSHLCYFISEHELAETKIHTHRFLGKKNKSVYFMRNAESFAEKAKVIEAEKGDKVVAVLFRDCDGTRSDKSNLWEEKVQSMEMGFERSGFSRGVPMIPKPKSEAWLICALKENPYHHCGILEDRSGNDDSPASLKGELKELCNGDTSVATITSMMAENRINPFQIDMPSFNAFKTKLQFAVENALTV